MKEITPRQIKKARKEAGLSQKKAAELIHCSREAWAQWELGNNKMPRAYWEYFKIRRRQ